MIVVGIYLKKNNGELTSLECQAFASMNIALLIQVCFYVLHSSVIPPQVFLS